MIILGLTGSIAMGKSQAAKQFRRHGVPVFDADKEVHKLYAKDGEAVPLIGALFPDAIVDGAVDRTRLAKQVLGNPAALKSLEKIIHPLVKEKEKLFLLQAKVDGAKIAVLEIPLLYEAGSHKKCDKIAVVSAPKFIQKLRALRREGMTLEKLESIRARQMPDSQKRKRADYIIRTGLHKGYTCKQVRKIIAELTSK